MSLEKGKLIWALNVLIMKHADGDIKVVRLVCESLAYANADESEKKYMGCLFLKLQNLIMSKKLRNSDVDAIFDFLMNVRIDIYLNFLDTTSQQVSKKLIEILPNEKLLLLFKR